MKKSSKSSKSKKITKIIIEDDNEFIDNDNESINDNDSDNNNEIINNHANNTNYDLSSEIKLDLSGYKFIDLFCGIGGFHQALSAMGAECVLACDIDKDCREVYKENYGIEPVPDVTKIDENTMPDFDILCGGFPCFIKGTKVLTDFGYKNIEDVKQTNKLLTHTGEFKSIVNLQRKLYSGTLYELNINCHPKIINCTEEHPFYIREKEDNIIGEPKWKIAKELTRNDYFGMVINDKSIIPEFNFNEDINILLNNSNEWFIMGYYLRYGSIEEHTKKIKFVIDKCDYGGDSDCKQVFDIINKVIKINDKNEYNNNFWECENNFWYEILKQFGKNENEKVIPEWVQNAPKECIREFINGYILSDYYIYIIYTDLAFAFHRLCLKIGKIFTNNKNTHLIYSILQDLPDSIFIDGNYVWYSPFQITKSETIKTPVYNFEVETDNSYIVENIIVHNCQAFSNGGKKKCFEDKRGLLFDEIIRIAEKKKPRFMFLENVKHILKVSNGEVIKYIKQKLDKTGYHLQDLTKFQISPHNYGIPQQRERVYFVCIRKDIFETHYAKKEIMLPPPIPKEQIQFEKFLDKKEEVHQRYFIKNDKEILPVLESWDEMIQLFEVGEKISPTIMINDYYKIKNGIYTQEDIDNFASWRTDYTNRNKPLIEKYESVFDEWYLKHSQLLLKREIYGKLEWQTGPIKENDSIFNHFIQIRQSGIRVRKGNYFPTLVAISQIPIYGKEKRYITPRECARLQSFPESFIMSDNTVKGDKKYYKQFGNSVNVDIVSMVIRSTIKLYCDSV